MGGEPLWVSQQCEISKLLSLRWDERSSGNSMMSEACKVFIHMPDWFRHIKDERLWAALMKCNVHMCSSSNTEALTPRVSPEVNWCHGDASQSSAKTTVNVNMKTRKKKAKWRGCFCVRLCVIVCGDLSVEKKIRQFKITYVIFSCLKWKKFHYVRLWS